MKKLVLLLVFIILTGCVGMKKANEFYENKNYPLAIEECRKAIEKDSLNAGAYLIMGKSYRALDKLDQAIHSFEAAYHIKPYSGVTNKAKQELINTRILKADMALKEKSYNVVFSEYKAALELDSTNFHACYRLGMAYEQNHWLDKAKFYYQKAAEINPDDQSIPKKLAMIDSLTSEAEKYFKKGKKYYLQRKNVSAVKYLTKALKNKDDYKDAKYYYYMARGKLLFKKGRKGQLWDAIEMFGNAMMIRPESAEPHYFLAKTYEKKDRNEFYNAINEYKIAVEKEPGGPFARASKKKIKELSQRQKKLKEFWGK